MPIPSRLISILAATAGGFLAHLAFPSANIWPAAIVGLGLYFYALGRDSARWAFLVGTLWGMGYFLPLLWWAHAAVGAVPWVALSFLQSLIMAISAAAYVWIRRTPPFRGGQLLLALPFAATIIVVEELRQHWPFGGFPWVRLAFSQTESPLLPLAGYVGAPGVGFVLAMLAAVTAVGVCKIPSIDLIRIPASILIVALGLITPMLIGSDVRPETGTLRIGAVQGNVANPGLNAFENAREVTTNHMDGTARLIEDSGPVDVVLWPENAADYDPRTDAESRDMINQASRVAGVPVLVGTSSYTDGTRYNEIVVWEGVDDIGDAYAKQVPAAFAEYIPMRDIIVKLAPVAEMVTTDMSAGTDPAYLDVPIAALNRDVRIAAIICFEVAYDWLITDAVLHGAELLYVPTNNASFGPTTESVQQLAMTRFRAVEHGRSAVQISTVGVSGYITPDGKLYDETELFTPAEFAADLPLRTSLTVAATLGSTPVNVLGVLVVIGVIAGMFGHRVPVRRK